MRYLIIIIITLFSITALAKDTKVYNPYGKFLFTIKNDGKIYGPYGKYLGKLDKKNNIKSPYGKRKTMKLLK